MSVPTRMTTEEAIFKNSLDDASRAVWHIFHVRQSGRRISKDLPETELEKLMKNLSDSIKTPEVNDSLDKLKEYLGDHDYTFPEWIFRE